LLCLGDQVINDVAAMREVLIHTVETQHRGGVAREGVGIWVDQSLLSAGGILAAAGRARSRASEPRLR
jgi:hypothetical protein